MPARDTAAIWRAAADALVAGDARTLDGLLQEHENVSRSGEPHCPGSEA